MQERDDLLFQAEVSKLNLFNAKKAAEDSRIKSLNAEMEVDLGECPPPLTHVKSEADKSCALGSRVSVAEESLLVTVVTAGTNASRTQKVCIRFGMSSRRRVLIHILHAHPHTPAHTAAQPEMPC